MIARRYARSISIYGRFRTSLSSKLSLAGAIQGAEHRQNGDEEAGAHATRARFERASVA